MDSHLQHKLEQFSAIPPDGAWHRIADALDAGESLGQRLLKYEELPPATTWQKIESGLDETAPAKVVPFTTRFQKPIRYVAVACFLAVVLVTVTLTFKRTEAGALDPENTITVQTNGATAPPLAEDQGRSTRPTGEAATRDAEAGISVSSKDRDHSTANTETISPANRKANKVSPVYSSLHEYVFFSDGDGKTRKIAKKLASYVNCKENDLPCKQRLKELRQRMAASAMTTDFTGVLDLLRQLQ